MNTTIELVRAVRDKYGDTTAQLAVRLNVSEASVNAWLGGSNAQESAKLLLRYALKYELTFKPNVSEQFQALSTPEKIETLRVNFNDNLKSFAERIGVHPATVWRWANGENPTGAQLRYIYEVAAYPERFSTAPKSFKA